MQVAIGKKAPKHNRHPKVQLHRQDNWKVAYEFMASAGINVKGIEPAGMTTVSVLIINAPMFPFSFRSRERKSCCNTQHVCQHSKMGREKSTNYYHVTDIVMQLLSIHFNSHLLLY